MASTDAAKEAAPAAAPANPLTSTEMRARMNAITMAAVAKLPPLSESLEELEIQIPVGDGWQSRTKIVRPKAHVQAKRPLIVHFFGGAMMVGEPEQLINVARAFAETYGAVVALPNYRLTPDVRWPVPYKDAWNIIAWLSKNATAELGADLAAGFVVGGVSAGGSLAAVCGGLAMFPSSKEARDVPKLASPLTGLFICVPWIIVDETLPSEYKAIHTSRKDNEKVESLNPGALNMIATSLQCTDYASPWFSPISAIVEREPENKIPVYIERCAFDPFRDDATVYGKLLEARGVPTKTRLFPEDVHGSWTVVAAPSKAKDPTMEEAQMEGMKWLLKSS